MLQFNKFKVLILVGMLLAAGVAVSGPLCAQNNRDFHELNNEVRNLFRFKKRHCKIVSIYTGVSQGSVIQTQEFGQAFVKDYKIGNRKVKYYRFEGQPVDGKKKDITVRKIRSIQNLVIWVPKEAEGLRNENGNSNLKTVRLNEEETKQVMIEQLVRRHRFDWITILYPEERKNIQKLIYTYSVPREPDPTVIP